MMGTPHQSQKGMTLIELMVVVAVAAILLTMAAPSFTDHLNRRRIEGVASELVTDLQYARSESAARNANVVLQIGAAGTCYTIYQTAASGSCNCQSTPVCTSPGPTEIKTVSFAGSDISSAATTFTFEPQRGSLVAGADTSATLTNSVGSLRADVLAIGRVRTCVPTGSFRGYSAC